MDEEGNFTDEFFERGFAGKTAQDRIETAPAVASICSCVVFDSVCEKIDDI